MFQEYIQKSTKKVLNTLEIAVSELVSLKQNMLTPEFVLLALLAQPDSEAVKIIETISAEPIETASQIRVAIQQRIQPAAPTNTTQIVASQELSNLFQIAYEEAKKLGDEFIATGTLFIAMFDSRVGHVAELLHNCGLRRGKVLEALRQLRHGQNISSQEAEAEADVLSKYTRDLTELARQGKLDPVIGRENEIHQIIQTLSRRKRTIRY